MNPNVFLMTSELRMYNSLRFFFFIIKMISFVVPSFYNAVSLPFSQCHPSKTVKIGHSDGHINCINQNETNIFFCKRKYHNVVSFVPSFQLSVRSSSFSNAMQFNSIPWNVLNSISLSKWMGIRWMFWEYTDGFRKLKIGKFQNFNVEIMTYPICYSMAFLNELS